MSPRMNPGVHPIQKLLQRMGRSYRLADALGRSALDYNGARVTASARNLMAEYTDAEVALQSACRFNFAVAG